MMIYEQVENKIETHLELLKSGTEPYFESHEVGPAVSPKTWWIFPHLWVQVQVAIALELCLTTEGKIIIIFRPYL